MDIIGTIVGLTLGIIWERYATSHSWNKSRSTLFPSLIFKTTGKSVHLHHWIFYLLGGAIVSFWAVKTDSFHYPAVLAVDSFFLAAMLYNFKKYPDWYKFYY